MPLITGSYTKLNVSGTAIYTVNVDIFAQYIFSRRALDARKFDVREKLNHNRTNRIN